MATAPEIVAAWTEVRAWLKSHRPDLFHDLRPGADAETLAALVGLGVPEEWCALWEANDGAGFVLFDGWSWLPVRGVVDSVLAEHEVLCEQAASSEERDPPATDGPVRADWGNSDWIPFAVDFSGCLLCIDLAPLDGGTRGQIIALDDESRRVIYDGPGSLFADCLLRMEMGVHPDEEPDNDTDEWVEEQGFPPRPAGPAVAGAPAEPEAAPAPIPPVTPSKPAEVIAEPTVHAEAALADDCAEAHIVLTPAERATGSTVFVRIPSGDVVGVRVPPGAWDGARLRIPGLAGESLDLVLVVGAAAS